MKRIERGKRHVTNYSYTGNFSDTCHSNGKIYVPHCHISKNHLQIRYLIRLIILFIKSAVSKTRRWAGKNYALTLVMVNAVMVFVGYLILRIQNVLFLNPNGIEGMDASLSFNTIISFMTNTNLQHYAGESGLSYASQMCVIIFMMFTSAASGYAACMAFAEDFPEEKWEIFIKTW